jgi:hypothetical protein
MNNIVEFGKLFSSLELSKFIGGIVFISIAYILGIFSNIFSRAIIDPLSELGFRNLTFRAFSHVKLSKLYSIF